MNFSNLCFAEHFVVWKVYKMLCKTYWVSITGDPEGIQNNWP
jgi:hypothetical protein